MFYARINKIKIINNRESFPGLFNSAKLNRLSQKEKAKKPVMNCPFAGHKKENNMKRFLVCDTALGIFPLPMQMM